MGARKLVPGFSFLTADSLPSAIAMHFHDVRNKDFDEVAEDTHGEYYRKRTPMELSSEDWKPTVDWDAQVSKMKDGPTLEAAEQGLDEEWQWAVIVEPKRPERKWKNGQEQGCLESAFPVALGRFLGIRGSLGHLSAVAGGHTVARCLTLASGGFGHLLKWAR